MPRLNRFAWNDLEKKTLEWVKQYERLWIIAGPVFDGMTPEKWINDEAPIAIPDAFFKIVIKEGLQPDAPDVLAFVYPNVEELLTVRDPSNYLVSVDEIEKKTGLHFFTRLPTSTRRSILNQEKSDLWD